MTTASQDHELNADVDNVNLDSHEMMFDGDDDLMFYSHVCVHGRLNGLNDLQR